MCICINQCCTVSLLPLLVCVCVCLLLLGLNVLRSRSVPSHRKTARASLQGYGLSRGDEPTPGPEAGVMNGTVRAGNPSPSQPAEPVGERIGKLRTRHQGHRLPQRVSRHPLSCHKKFGQADRRRWNVRLGWKLGYNWCVFYSIYGNVSRCGRGSANWNGPGLWSNYCAKWNSCFWSYTVPDGPGQILSAADTGGGTGSMDFEPPRSMLPGVC